MKARNVIEAFGKIDCETRIDPETKKEQQTVTCAFSGKQAYDFVLKFRQSEEYKQLQMKEQKSMTTDELIGFALTTDDITKIDRDLLYSALVTVKDIYPGDITAGLVTMCLAIDYHHTHKNMDLLCANLKNRCMLFSYEPAYINLAGIHFEKNITIDAPITNANLENADLRNVTIKGNITHSNFQRAKMQDVKFIDSAISKSDFSSADMTNISGVKFSLCECTMMNTNLTRAVLANEFALAKIDMTGAILNDARISPMNHVAFGLNFTNASLIGTKIESALITSHAANITVMANDACQNIGNLRKSLDGIALQIQLLNQYANKKIPSIEVNFVQAALKKYSRQGQSERHAGHGDATFCLSNQRAICRDEKTECCLTFL